MNKKTTSLELSKRLHEVAEEKVFELPMSEKSWKSVNYATHQKMEICKTIEINNPMIAESFGKIYSFDCQELGEIIYPYLGESDSFIMGKRLDENTFRLLMSDDYFWDIPFFTEKNEVEARAKMLIYLIENDLIKN